MWGIKGQYIGKRKSQFCETSAKVTKWVTDGCVSFCEQFVVKGREF